MEEFLKEKCLGLSNDFDALSDASIVLLILSFAFLNKL